MQKNTPTKTTFISLIVIVILALLVYFYYKGSSNVNPESSVSVEIASQSAEARASTERVIQLLNIINSLKIDTKFFEGSVYKSLVDYTIPVQPQPIGRTNPFAPIGSVR